jgi:hypothetical protein
MVVERDRCPRRASADLENHWLLADRFIEVLTLNSPPGARDGGRVRMRGPVGPRRTATTRGSGSPPLHLMIGAAQLGRRTRACVSWALTPCDGETSVRLTAALDDAGLLDRLLPLLGGRWWMRRRFVTVLVRLAEQFTIQRRPLPARAS